MTETEKIILKSEKILGELDISYLNHLDKYGFCLLDDSKRIINWLEKDLNFIKDLIGKLIDDEGEKAGFEGREEHYKEGKKFEPNSHRLGNLPNKNEVFKKFVMFPDILKCAKHVIRDEIMFSSSNFREPLKNSGDQRLHIDWLPRATENQKFESIIAMYYLDYVVLGYKFLFDQLNGLSHSNLLLFFRHPSLKELQKNQYFLIL